MYRGSSERRALAEVNQIYFQKTDGSIEKNEKVDSRWYYQD